MRRYAILLTPDTEVGGYTVSVPALPGCFTEGDTFEEALTNAREAIVGHIAALEYTGQPLPDEEPPPILRARQGISLPYRVGESGRVS